MKSGAGDLAGTATNAFIEVHGNIFYKVGSCTAHLSGNLSPVTYGSFSPKNARRQPEAYPVVAKSGRRRSMKAPIPSCAAAVRALSPNAS